LRTGEKVQTYICRECGYRFSEKKLGVSLKENQQRAINSHVSIIRHNQICALEAKNLEPQTEPKTVAGEITQQDSKGKIVTFEFWLLKQGYSKSTITSRRKLLSRLLRLGANFNDEESVKAIIARATWSISRKINAVDAYDSLLKMEGKTWTPPIYKRVRKLPFIPNEGELDQLIAGSSRRMATFLQMLKETGMRSGEACMLKWSDIDLVNNCIRVIPEKNSNPRNLSISNKLVSMLNAMPQNTQRAFTYNTDAWIRNYSRQRKKITFKLKNPRLLQIHFHTFRHWKATTEYHKTKDILHVKEMLGHKSINNTLLYTQLVVFKDDDFTARVAHSEIESCQLIEAGFEFVCDFNGNKLFRKRK